jgi:hypothetical protein
MTDKTDGLLGCEGKTSFKTTCFKSDDGENTCDGGPLTGVSIMTPSTPH